MSLVFLITRLPYYIHYPVFTISNDTASYIAAALQILEHSWPMFDIRTPGYPLFIAVIMSLSPEFVYVSLAQSLLTYFSAIFFLAAAFRYYPKQILYFAVAVCGFISSVYFLVLEVSILTEGIFTSIMLVAAGVLLIAVKSESVFSWIMFSLLSAIIIYIRPAGLFLVALVVPLVIFFIVNKYSFRFYAALIAPFSMMIGILCLYNYQTLGKFTITPFGEANLAGVTVMFMEPSDSYPQFVNKAIQTTLDSIPRSEKNIVMKSYNPNRLFKSFRDYFHMQMHLVNNMKHSDSTITYLKAQPYLRQVSIDAIKRHPDVYAKFFLSNFYYFFTNIGRSIDYSNELEKKFEQVYVDSIYVKQLESGKWSQISESEEYIGKVRAIYVQKLAERNSLEGFIVDQNNNANLRNTFLIGLYKIWESFYEIIFRNLLWLIAFGIMLFMCIRLLIRTRFTDKDAFIAFAFSLIFIFKALLVSIVESSLERYSYTVDFVIYMSLPFILILFAKSKEIKNTPRS